MRKILICICAFLMISVATPAQASAPTLEFSLLNVEQGKTSSISMEFKTQGGPAQFKVKIFQRKGLFTSQNEMLSFEEKNSVVKTGLLVGEASGVANSDVATRIRIPIDTSNKKLGVVGYVAQITSGATEFGQLNFFLSSKYCSRCPDYFSSHSWWHRTRNSISNECFRKT